MQQIINWLKWRINQNKNNLIIVCGETGSGKTFRALSIAEKIKPDFDPATYVVFKSRDFFNLLNQGKLKKGDVIIWEEGGVEASNRSWYSVQNKLINFAFQTMRHRNFTLIMTVPALHFIDSALQKLFHMYIECKYVDEKLDACRCKVMRMEYNSRYDKLYFKYFRLTNPITKQKFIANNVWINKPTQKVIDVYEPMKKAFTDKLYLESEQELNKIDAYSKKDWGASKDYNTQIEWAKAHKDELYQKCKDGHRKITSNMIKARLDAAGLPISMTGAGIVKAAVLGDKIKRKKETI
jgi:hypothetical protein